MCLPPEVHQACIRASDGPTRMNPPAGWSQSLPACLLLATQHRKTKSCLSRRFVHVTRAAGAESHPCSGPMLESTWPSRTAALVLMDLHHPLAPTARGGSGTPSHRIPTSVRTSAKGGAARTLALKRTISQNKLIFHLSRSGQPFQRHVTSRADTKQYALPLALARATEGLAGSEIYGLCLGVGHRVSCSFPIRSWIGT